MFSTSPGVVARGVRASSPRPPVDEMMTMMMMMMMMMM